jgi:hypothetical protein
MTSGSSHDQQSDKMQQEVDRLQTAVAETSERLGNSHVEVAYRLEELATAMRANSQLLDAANAQAKAKAIRKAALANDTAGAELIENGSLSLISDRNRNVAFKRYLLVGCAALFVVSLLFKSVSSSAAIVLGVVGPAALSLLVIFAFSHLKMNRTVKYTIITAICGLIWELMAQIH